MPEDGTEASSDRFVGLQSQDRQPATSSRPVSRSRKHTLRRRAPYAESGRSITEFIDAQSADTRHLAMSWVARISAPSESRAGCNRVVAYRTQSNLCILQSILAHRQVVPGTPGKLLGSNSEKLQGFSPNTVQRLLPKRKPPVS